MKGDGGVATDFTEHGKVEAAFPQWVFPVSSEGFLLQIPERLSTQGQHRPRTQGQAGG